MGTPVIAADAGGPKEIIVPGKTGLLTQPGDSDALVNAVRQYLQDKDWTSQITDNALQDATNRFSSKTMVDHFRELVFQTAQSH